MKNGKREFKRFRKLREKGGNIKRKGKHKEKAD
jgi:hypothetical protein